MKKVTLTFVVDEATILEVENELEWRNLANAVAILEDSCVSSDYDIKDVEG